MRSESVGRPTDGDRGAAPPALSSEAPTWQRSLAAVAATLQAIVIMLAVVSGMGLWAGWSYFAVANVVAVLGLVLVLFVANRTGRSGAVIALLAVPVISVVLIQGLMALEGWQLARGACSDLELEAVAGLESPDGKPLAFAGTYEGCEARVDSRRASGELTADFASTLRTAGWTVRSPDGGRMAYKDGVTLFVDPLTESIKEEKLVGFTGILVSVDDNAEQ